MSNKNGQKNGKDNSKGGKKNGKKGQPKGVRKPKVKRPSTKHDHGPKYGFHGDAETVKINDVEYTIHRIVALRTFGTGRNTVREGDIGGYVENESNLSHADSCWVRDNAMAIGSNAKVMQNAQLRQNAIVMDDAIATGDSEMFGISRACDDSRISGRARMFKGRIVKGYCLTGNDVMDVDEVRAGYEPIVQEPKPEAKPVHQAVADNAAEVQNHRAALRALSAILWEMGFTRLYRTVSLPACLEVAITMNSAYSATLRLRHGKDGYEYILFNGNRRVSSAKDCSPADFAGLIMKLDVSQFVCAAA